jgi:hypothetical protein
MGFFQNIFGTSGSAYAQDERPLSIQKIKELVSRYRLRSLDVREEAAIERALSDRRKGDGKISLRQIDEALAKLEHAYKISKQDRKGMMKIFQDEFSKES